MKIQKMVFASLLVAIGTMVGHVIYIPVGVAKCFPIQHTINVISAVLLGPYYAVLICLKIHRKVRFTWVTSHYSYALAKMVT